MAREMFLRPMEYQVGHYPRFSWYSSHIDHWLIISYLPQILMIIRKDSSVAGGLSQQPVYRFTSRHTDFRVEELKELP